MEVIASLANKGSLLCMAACMAALYGRKLALYSNLVPSQYFVPVAKNYIVIVFILLYYIIYIYYVIE